MSRLGSYPIANRTSYWWRNKGWGFTRSPLLLQLIVNFESFLQLKERRKGNALVALPTTPNLPLCSNQIGLLNWFCPRPKCDSPQHTAHTWATPIPGDTAWRNGRMEMFPAHRIAPWVKFNQYYWAQFKILDFTLSDLFRGLRLLRVPWTARRSNQSILKEISPEYSLEGLMLKLKLQYFGHLMQRTESLEKTLMLEKIEGGRRRGWQDEIVGWHYRHDGH